MNTFSLPTRNPEISCETGKEITKNIAVYRASVVEENNANKRTSLMWPRHRHRASLCHFCFSGICFETHAPETRVFICAGDGT
jgi:hypothetical protein